MAYKGNSKEKTVSLRPLRYIPPNVRVQEKDNFMPSSCHWGEDHSLKQKLPLPLPGGFVKLSSLVRGKPQSKAEPEVSNLKSMDPNIFNSIDSVDTVGQEAQPFTWPDGDVDITDWRDILPTMQQQFTYMLRHEVRTDCTCIVGETQKKVFRCHKVMLSRASNVLDKMVHEYDEIEILDVEPPVFQHLLQYMYSGEIELESSEQALHLCHAAITYNVTQLRDLCANFLCDNLTPDTFWGVLEVVLNIATPASFKNRCLQFLQTNAQSCLISPQLVLTNLACLVWLLEQERIDIESEMDMILAATCWAIRETQTGWLFQDAPSSPCLLRQALGPAFSLLRFLSLTPAQFSLGLADSDLLSEHEKFTILVNIITPGHIPLPEGICSNTSTRNCTDMSPKHSKLATQFNVCSRLRVKMPFCQGVASKTTVSTLEFMCDKDIHIVGVQVSTQHKMRHQLPDETNNNNEVCDMYDENVVVTLLSQGKVLNQVTYTQSVAYNAQLPVLFNTGTSLCKDTLYTIRVHFKRPGIYLTYMRASHVVANDISFKFTHEDEVGLIEALAFSI